MILETKRLMLRELREDDFEDMCEMLCDAEVMWAYGHVKTMEEAHDLLVLQQQRYVRDGAGLWALIRKSDGVMIGQCGLKKQILQKQPVWEMAYLLKKQYWHQGYAIEAAKGVKRYAQEHMRLDAIYAVIRDCNIASQRVAMACGMHSVDRFIKHDHSLDMLHIVYKVARKEAQIRYHIYLDGEFDAVFHDHKYHQRVISLGAVCCDANGVECATFYETLCPQGFQKLSKIVRRMTHLDDACIASSRRLCEVIKAFSDWIHSFDADGSSISIYSFGPDDRRTILQHCVFEQVEIDGLLENVIDLQKVISREITYHDRILSPTLSLEDMKQVYSIQGAVEHNALTDAKDLMEIHWAYLRHRPLNEHHLQEIVRRKEQTAAKARIKQQKQFRKNMQERFAHMSTCVSIVFHKDVLEQLRNWKARDAHFKLQFKKDHMMFEGRSYSYDQLRMWLRIDTIADVPSVTLGMQYEGEQKTMKYLLSYRNATPIEGIIKRCQRECDHE